MRVILNTPAIAAHHGTTVGSEADIPDALAALYVKRGQARAVKAPPKKKTAKKSTKS